MSKEKERKATTRKTRAVQSMSVVQQSLTTEVVKENLTSEERAIAEAKTIISEYANNSHISREYEYYAEGYLSGYHSRDEEVKELRKALKELTVSIDAIYRNYESGHIEGLFNSLTNAWAYCIEAKQLLKEEEI